MRRGIDMATNESLENMKFISAGSVEYSLLMTNLNPEISRKPLPQPTKDSSSRQVEAKTAHKKANKTNEKNTSVQSGSLPNQRTKTDNKPFSTSMSVKWGELTTRFKGWNYFLFSLILVFVIAPIYTVAISSDATRGLAFALAILILSIPGIVIMAIDKDALIPDKYLVIILLLGASFLAYATVINLYNYAPALVVIVGLIASAYTRLTKYPKSVSK